MNIFDEPFNSDAPCCAILLCIFDFTRAGVQWVKTIIPWLFLVSFIILYLSFLGGLYYMEC